MPDREALTRESAPGGEGFYYRVQWWAPETEDGEDRVLEIQRTDPDEIMVTIRGISGSEDVGSFYLTVDMARVAAAALEGEADRTWEAGGE